MSYDLLLAQERFLLEASELVQRWLDERGLRRKQLADLLGTSKSHVSQLLSGEANMTLATLAEIAFVLDREVHLVGVLP